MQSDSYYVGDILKNSGEVGTFIYEEGTKGILFIWNKIVWLVNNEYFP